MACFIAVIGTPFLGVLGGLILPNLPVWAILIIWLFIIIFVIVIDKIFHRMLCRFVKEEVEKGGHDERIIKTISHLIKVKNNRENIIRDSEIKKNYVKILKISLDYNQKKSNVFSIC